MIYDNSKTDLFYNFTTDGDPFAFCEKRKIDTMEARKIMLATKEKCDAVLKVLDQVEKEAEEKNQVFIFKGCDMYDELRTFEAFGFEVKLKRGGEVVYIEKNNYAFMFRRPHDFEIAAGILKLVQGGLNART